MSKAPKPKTNLEGLELVLSLVSLRRLAQELTALRQERGKRGITHAGVAKWRENNDVGVPHEYVNDVCKITGLKPEQVRPQTY